MAKKWNEVVNNPEYKKLSPEQQEEARNEYFDNVVKPNVPNEDLAKARSEFDDFSTISTGEKIANVYKEGITGLKDLGTNILTAPLRTGKAIIDSVDSRSVTNNSDRNLDGTTPEATGFDQSAGGRVLSELTAKQPDTLKAGSRIVDGLSGVVEVGLNKGYAGIGRIGAGALSLASDVTGSETLKKLSDDQLKYADQVENSAVLRGTKSTAFEPDSIIQEVPRVATDAIGSTITSAPAIVAGAVTGGGALPAIFATTAVSDYGTSGDDLSTGGKVAHAIGTGAAETLGEKLGGTDKFADALTKVLGGKNALAELGVRLLTSGAKEIPSEEVTTTAQFLLDKNKLFGLNQDATLDDYIEQVKETAKVAAMQGAGMAGAGGIIKAVKLTGDKPEDEENDAEAAKQSALNAWKTNGLTNNGQRLTISQGGNPADDALAAQKQAEYDAAESAIAAQKAEKLKTLPDQNLQNLRKTAQTLNPADVPVIDAEIERRASLGTLTRAAEISQHVDPLAAQPQTAPIIPATNEAINAADLLEGDNVSNLPSDAPASVVTDPTQAAGNNVQGSVGNLPDQYAGRNDTGRIDNPAETPAQSSGSDQPAINGTQGNDAVAILNGEDAAARPFAQATDDFLPQMRSMTTDQTIIKQIDDELARRGIAEANKNEIAPVTIAEPESASWVIRNKETGEPIMETSQKSVADKTNKDKYEVVPILQHLQELNQKGSKASNYAQINTGAKSNAQTKAPEPFMRNESQEQSLSNAQEAMIGDMQNVAAPSETPVAQPVQKPAKAAKPKAVKHKTLLATLRDLGGVAITEKQDITGEIKGFAAGGYNQIFKSNSKRSMKGLIESGDLDEYLPYNMRLESNGANDEAFDSTEAYDYLADKIRNGESVLPYSVQEELRALKYEGDAVNDVADELTEDEINDQLSQASNEERESATNARVFNTDSENSGTESSAGRETEAQPSQTSQDLLGDNTAAKQALADAERTKDAKRNAGTDNPEAFTITGSTSEADQAAAAGAQDLFATPKAESKPSDTSKDKVRFANNKIFTADKVEAARARLKAKLNTLNSGIDPELMIDGMMIAGAYIEDGVRKFSDYAKAMTEDLGDSIKPYLLSFYEAARAYPNIDKEGMTDQESAAKEHQALLTPAVLDQAKEVIGQGVVESDKAKAKPNGQLKLTQDWGVDSIDGWTDNKDGTGTNERENGVTNGVKDQFLAESKKYLTQVAKLLEAEGWEAHKDKRGRTQKPVSVNESGVATSGDASLTMRKGNAGVYVNLGTSSIRGLTGNHPQGVSVMIRATGSPDTDQYATKGQNIWLSTDLSSTELANKLMQTAERYVKNTLQAEEGNQNARATTTEQVPAGSAQSNLLAEQSGRGDSKPLDSGLARPSEGDAGQGRVSSGVSETSGNRTSGTSGSNGNEPPSGSRETSNAGNTASAANGVNDFEITDETGIGEGSIAQKYKDNITAIKLIKTLETEKRAATPEERNQLAKYNGFGALSKVFEKNNPKYQELKDLLTDAEYEAARASILNAYYTSPTIVKAMYDAVAHMGFKGGRVLEPSLGSGNFFGMMPAAMRNKSKLNGVELDVITSRLAKYLYPNANIAVATGFEKYQAPQGYFDLVISNPPFGSEPLRDSEKADYSGFSIHNFFIAKSIDKLRDDGILAVVVSHNFMDAMDTKAREWISKRAVLRGAVRLPRTAFKDNAGTEVITDVLFFQKTNMPDQNPDWVTSKDHGDYFFNDYFSANPMNVLGRVEDITSQYGKTYTVESTGDMAKQINEFIKTRLMADVYVEPEKRIEVLDSADSTIPDGVKVGTYYTDEKGIVRQRLPDLLGAKRSSAWEAPNAKAQERMLGMMALRDMLRNQMRLERDPMATAKEIERNRERMNQRYDEFVKKQGYLNSTTNRRLFIDDTESALLQALEIDYDQGVSAAKAAATGMDEKPASAGKADIFSRRVLFPPSDSITVNNAKDALLASLNVKGVVDADYMAEVYSKDADAIIGELGDLVYNDPLKGYVTADEYLSGDVKTKLVEAKAKAKADSKFTRNVEALEKVIPKDKLPSEIYASAGANWIPADVYADFAAEITGIPKDAIEFKYVPAAAMWLSEKTRGGDTGKMTSDYGTSDINSFELFHMLVNGKAPEVREIIGYGSDRKSVVNIEKTEAARSKLEKVKEAWNSWVFKDADRADRLATIYNDKHNRTVARKFDGSHMQFYGMSPAVTLRAHQKDVVWRAIQDRNVLLDHVVGAGKTMAMASIAMEMKRLGIARKPMFVVPNHLTLQWRSEFTKLYPASNILAATPEDFAKDKREKLFSKMVTGNYDAIIIGHSSLTKVGLPAEVEEKMYQEQVNELADAIEIAKSDRGDRGITRDMEKIKKNIEAKIEKLKEKAGAKDNVVSFDELGVDAMFIDEMHEFKNLFFTTQMQRTAGLGNPSGSGKALDLFMKIKFMTETYGEDVPLITATGTPVSNSLAEMYTMQRYMKYPEMKRQDLHMFDAWAKQFGEVENVYEVAPSGVGYRQSTRFSKFKNLPALMGGYTSFADIITMQDLKDQTAAQIDPQTGKPKVFPVPKLRSGKPINVIAQRSELQRDFFGVPQLAINDKTGEIEFELDPENAIIEQNKEGKYQIIAQVTDDNGDVIGRRSIGNSFDTKEDAELELVTKALTPKTFIDPKSLLGQFANLAQLTRESKGKINALSLTGLANKSGLDYRIIDPSAPDFAGSKINQAVTNMVDLWKETAKDKGTQIVFCDLSIPNSARNDMSSKERRIYVRDRDGELTHKAKGIVFAPEGYEGFPFYITKGRNGFDVYEAVTGTMVRDYGLNDKAAAKAWIANYVESESSRDRIFGLRDTKTIDQSDIDEYRDAKELELADDGSNEISTADLEAVAGSSKFSVYDDIRAKLLKAGVPENQIAFIHDYNTPKQKEELFKRVNNGDVRFLFGSTPKLGAGTNVQKRLVGLHHIDAPWRPSDLEQREGRIIRQGNDLYARDPENFEIAIWRYATEQTYDTRRWQLLEHKAAGIEQLRKYTGEAEIEDVASEASNSADMKAAASGNPLILEETKLRTEVKRLINLEKAHADSQYAMARKVRDNTNYINDYLPKKIAEYERMQDVTKAHPIPSDKDKVATMKVDGKVVSAREAAENAIADLALKTRSLATLNETPRVIEYRGIQFTVNRGLGMNTLALRSPDSLMHTYGDREGVSPSGLITRFNNYIDSFAARIEDANNAIEKAKIENESLSSRLNEPYEQAALLKQTQAEHANVQRRLMKSSQLESVPEDQRPEFDRLVKDRKETLKQLGLEKALKESESDSSQPVFARGTGANSTLSKATIQTAVNNLRSRWKNAPEIIVVQDMNDPAIPKAVRDENERQLSQGAQGQPEAFFHGGKVYIVSSEMKSADDVVRVVFHEALGHYGLRGLYGKELGAILDQVAMLRKRDMIKKAKQYGLDLNVASDKRIAAEEILAEMAQTAPSVGFVKRAVAAIRQFLRSVGIKLALTDNDIIANYLLPARRYVVNGRSDNSVKGLVSAFTRNVNNDVSIAQLFQELTFNDEVFQYGRSSATDMQQVFDDVVPQLVHVEKTTAPVNAQKQYVIYPIDSKGRIQYNQEGAINIYPDGKVEVNVAAWDKGYGGSGIYAAVGNWAYNNGKVFAGDRDGITSTGKLRRLENMISLALKFGTTDHIAPHPDQMRELGFGWKDGDTTYNIGQMLEASYNAIRNGVYVEENRHGYEITYKSPNALGVAKLDDLVYDFDKNQFTDISNGQQFTDSDFSKLAASKEARATNAGSTTLKRAAIAHTFVREQGAGRQRLLERIGQFTSQALEGTQLKGTFYSRSNTKIETPEFKKWFGNSKVVDAEGKPLVVYHGTSADFNEFSPLKKGSNTGWDNTTHGFFFIADKKLALDFANENNSGGTVSAKEVYLSIKNPIDLRKVSIFTNQKQAGDIVEFLTGGEEQLTGNDAIEWLDENIGLGEYDEMFEKFNSKDFNDFLINKGYDGLISNFGNDTAEYVAFDPAQIKSAADNNGDFDPSNPDIRFSRTPDPMQSRLTPQWETLEDSTWSENLRRTLQDKNIDLKRVTQSIKAAGVNLADRWNAYLQEELYHGRSAKRVQDFLDNELNPLIENMRELKVSMADLEQYLWNRHAEERNIQVAKVNPDMQDGGSGITTKAAQDYLAALTPEQKANYEALAARVYAINAGSRQTLVDYGLESAGTIAAWNKAYKNYVPLKRDEMDLGFGMGTGQGFSVKGAATKRAMGSSKGVVDIIANIAQQREQYIIRGEKNRVATALIGLAKTNPNEDFWQVDKPPRIKAISKETGLVEEYTDPTYKNHPNVIVARIVNKLGEVEERSVVFEKSNERAMQLAASMKNLDVDQMESWLRNWVAPVTRYIASVNTQYNPIFGILNITRDVQGALLNLTTTPIAGKQKDVLVLTGKAMLGIYKELRSVRAGNGAVGNQWSTLWEEFQREGGKTGYRDMFANAAERTKAIESALDPEMWKSKKLGIVPVGKVAQVITLNGLVVDNDIPVLRKLTTKHIFNLLSDYNETLENSVRLATYKVAIDSGISKQQAASIAKNISVNFNRKGNMGQNIGALYAFFNASVQGTARIGETLTGKRGQQIIAGGMLLGAIQAVMMMAAGFGDDEPPEFVRDRNIIIPLGNKKYSTIPMPLGFNAIPNLGRILTEWALSGFDKTNDRFIHILGMTMDVFNPVGGNGSVLNMLAPTFADPIVDLSTNKDWTGRQISREDFNKNAQTAGFTRSRDKTWTVSRELARFINTLSGGTDYTAGHLSPTGDAIEYLTGQAFGGVGRELIKAGTTADALLSGEDLPPYKVPLVGRFYGNANGQSAQGSEFYNNLRMLGKHETEIKGRRADKISTEDYRKENPEAALIAQARQSQKIVSNLQKIKQKKVDAGAPAADVKAVDERITKQMQKLNDLVRKKKAAAEQ